MKRLKLLALAVAGVVLPVALVFSAYMVARGSIGKAGGRSSRPSEPRRGREFSLAGLDRGQQWIGERSGSDSSGEGSGDD
jgi:hypothetical protein